jgi:hypothetical protein
MAVTKLVRAHKETKTVSSRMETRVFNREEAQAWVVPPFQRPLHVNAKVRALAEEMKQNGGIISGVITLGKLPNDKTEYLVDGQHRREAFLISDLPEMLSDVRTCIFDTIADMADQFVLLQQQLVRMRPDDILRGLEASTRSLKIIRETCPFVGYDQIRRVGSNSPVVSMAMVLRFWIGSEGDTPQSNKYSATAAQIAKEMNDLETTTLCKFLHLAHSCWGNDHGYARLWGGLNLGLCMWMYRRLVIDQDRSTNRAMHLNTDLFKKCLMAMSAEPDYTDWLSGRTMTDHHRSPCYRRIKAIFAKRLKEERIENPRFPSPAWAST